MMQSPNPNQPISGSIERRFQRPRSRIVAETVELPVKGRLPKGLRTAPRLAEELRLQFGARFGIDSELMRFTAVVKPSGRYTALLRGESYDVEAEKRQREERASREAYEKSEKLAKEARDREARTPDDRELSSYALRDGDTELVRYVYALGDEPISQAEYELRQAARRALDESRVLVEELAAVSEVSDAFSTSLVTHFSEGDEGLSDADRRAAQRDILRRPTPAPTMPHWKASERKGGKSVVTIGALPPLTFDDDAKALVARFEEAVDRLEAVYSPARSILGDIDPDYPRPVIRSGPSSTAESGADAAAGRAQKLAGVHREPEVSLEERTAAAKQRQVDEKAGQPPADPIKAIGFAPREMVYERSPATPFDQIELESGVTFRRLAAESVEGYLYRVAVAAMFGTPTR